MKMLYFILIIVFIACQNKKMSEVANNSNQYKTNQSIYDSLKYYFDKHEIIPSIVINNTEDTQTTISILNHKIQWINTEAETKIKIDDDLFSLKEKMTLNDVSTKGKRNNVDFANNWAQIKYYNFNNNELIGITMIYTPCTGTGCSVSFCLLYDLKSKTKNFFGTYRNEDELKLYHFNNDTVFSTDYVSKCYDEIKPGLEVFTYGLYSLDKFGQFIEQKEPDGNSYQIIDTVFENDSTSYEKLENNWFERIK